MTRATRAELERFARATVNRAKILTPVDTGRLRASISSTRINTPIGPGVRIGTVVEYAVPVMDGTRPRVIRPRRAQALRFVIGGRVVFARSVRHPGTRARPFLDRALRETAARFGWQWQSRL